MKDVELRDGLFSARSPPHIRGLPAGAPLRPISGGSAGSLHIDEERYWGVKSVYTLILLIYTRL